jgi:hypothetical protein
MNTDHLINAALYSRTPSIPAAGRPEAMGIGSLVLAVVLSLWPRSSHPPNVPDNLRADLGLDAEYRPQSWYQIELDALRRSRSKRPDHE